MFGQDDIAELLHLLNTHRQTLSISLNQRAMFGVAHVPPSIVHTINDCRNNIQRIKQVLRKNDVDVADLPNDEDIQSINIILNSLESKFQSPILEERLDALSDIARFRLQQYLDTVLHALLHDPDELVRERAAWTTDYLNNPKAIPSLITALNDTSWSVRSNVGWALVHLGRSAIPAVRQVVSESSNKDAREMARLILERI